MEHRVAVIVHVDMPLRPQAFPVKFLLRSQPPPPPGGGGWYSPNKVDGGVPLKWVTFLQQKKSLNMGYGFAEKSLNMGCSFVILL